MPSGRHQETPGLLTSLSSSPLISSSSSLAEKIFCPQARQRVLRKYASVCSESRLLRSCSLSAHSINFRSHAVHKGNDGREIHGTQDSSGHVQVNHLDSAPVTGRNVSSHFRERTRESRRTSNLWTRPLELHWTPNLSLDATHKATGETQLVIVFAHDAATNIAR